MKKPTIYDVAEHANVSAATVSLALSDRRNSKISIGTRKRVLDAVEQLGYQKRTRASSNRRVSQPDETLRAPSIAIIVDEICLSDPFLKVFNSLREGTDKHGYISDIYEYGESIGRLERIIGNINTSDTTGVIFATHRTREIENDIVSLIQAPVVLLNCYTEGETIYPTVLPGDSAGAYDATAHLIETGRSRIAHITGDMNDIASQERLSGYRRALISNDIPIDHRLIVRGGWNFNHGYESTKSLLDLDNKPDAIVCANDLSAIGCYFALTEVGINIGGDIAVVGYDNLPLCSTLSPTLTSMTIPYAEMLTFALEELFTQLANNQKNLRVTKIESHLIKRESA